MRSMVKLHDLVDLAEPPWRNMEEASSYGRSREETMELDADMVNRDEDATEPLASPSEANLGLG